MSSDVMYSQPVPRGAISSVYDWKSPSPIAVDGERRPDANECLRHESAIGCGERFLLAQQRESRIRETNSGNLERRFVRREKERDLVLDGNVDGILLAPAYATCP